jgi:hypothetical protein
MEYGIAYVASRLSRENKRGARSAGTVPVGRGLCLAGDFASIRARMHELHYQSTTRPAKNPRYRRYFTK